MKKGFTLIELLVVVLIIGILAAVALPQYEKAVARSRAAEAVLISTAIAQALDRYQMANGTFTTELENLDITVPESDNYLYQIMETSPGKNTRVFATAQKEGLASFEYAMTGSRRRWCFAQVDDPPANNACRTYGPFDHVYDGITNYYKIN